MPHRGEITYRVFPSVHDEFASQEIIIQMDQSAASDILVITVGGNADYAGLQILTFFINFHMLNIKYLLKI